MMETNKDISIDAVFRVDVRLRRQRHARGVFVCYFNLIEHKNEKEKNCE